MLEVEEKGYNNSDTLTRQPFRLSKKWRKKWEPNVDLMDNHLINHNLINHNLSRISDSKEDSCSSAINKSDSIETDLDIRTLEHESSFSNKMQSYKPQCPDFEAADCPFSCCVFLCLLAKHSRSKKKNAKKQQKERRSLKYSSNSIGNTTASTVQEDDLYGKNSNNVPTRVSSQTNLNTRGSNENIPSVPDEPISDEPLPNAPEQIVDESFDETLDYRRYNKNTQV